MAFRCLTFLCLVLRVLLLDLSLDLILRLPYFSCFLSAGIAPYMPGPLRLPAARSQREAAAAGRKSGAGEPAAETTEAVGDDNGATDAGLAATAEGSRGGGDVGALEEEQQQKAPGGALPYGTAYHVPVVCEEVCMSLPHKSQVLPFCVVKFWFSALGVLLSSACQGSLVYCVRAPLFLCSP